MARYHHYPPTKLVPARFRDIQASVTETDAGTEPITLAAVKTHLRVEHSGDDAELTQLAIAARSACESRCHRTIRVNRKLRYTYSRLPESRQIELPYPPLVSLDEVSYLAEDESIEILDPSRYLWTTSQRNAGYIQMPDSQNWYDEPHSLKRRDRFRIDFTVGYADAADVPADLVHAIKVQCDLLWDHDAQPSVLARYEETLATLLSNWDPGSYA